MKILKKAVTPDGVEIQVEDWSEDFSIFTFGSTIAAYPKKYMRRRAQLELLDNQTAVTVFEELESGNKSVLEFDFTVMEAGGNRVPLKPILERRMKFYKL